jgi:seryl-tRNA synthetase
LTAFASVAISHVVVLLPQVGSQRDFGFDPKDHVALGEQLDILDFETASEVRMVFGSLTVFAGRVSFTLCIWQDICFV